MQIVRNESYVNSRVRIGNWTHIASLALLVVGFILSLLPNWLGFGKEESSGAIFGAYVAMIGALLLLNFGRGFTRRFGPRFRQDQLLVAGLRGLDNRHTLYNYAAPNLPDHVLVGPTGLYIFIPKFNSGRIQFDGRRWSRGSLGGALLRNIAEGGLGNPTTEVQRAMSQLADYLKKHGSEELIRGLEAKPVIVFTNPQAQLEVRNSPIQVVQIRELRSIFRRAKPVLSPEKVDALKAVIGREIEEP